jgi:hypothetical protein
MNNNQNLFFYGLWAMLIQIIGIMIIAFSFLLFFVNGILAFIGIIIEIVIIFYGKSKRFDYQMKSGNIIHRGDW